MVGLETDTIKRFSTDKVDNRYSASEGLRTYVLQEIPSIGLPRPCREICEAVREEYGRVSRRHINRALAALMRQRKIVYVTDGWCGDWGYLRAKRGR
jgi:hypothetical protein